jgi:hypothetical protein
MDTALLHWWSCDVLQDEGRRRFRSMVTEIEQACENLECKYFIEKEATLAHVLQNQRTYVAAVFCFNRFLRVG